MNRPAEPEAGVSVAEPGAPSTAPISGLDASATERTDGRPDRGNGPLNAAISDAVVHIFRDYLGRGPTKTRTSIRDNVVVVLLEDTLTKAEKTLAAEGQTEAILQMRRTFQKTMREALTGAVAQLTGRRVTAFMSDDHTDPDYAIEAFVLEPPAHEDGRAGARRQPEGQERLTARGPAGGGSRGRQLGHRGYNAPGSGKAREECPTCLRRQAVVSRSFGHDHSLGRSLA